MEGPVSPGDGHVVNGGHQMPTEIASVSANVAGRDLIDAGLTNGSGLTAYVQVPFLGVSMNLHQLLRLVVLLGVVSFLAYFLFGFRVRSLF